MNIKDLKPDKNNANRGTERGRDALQESIKRLGAGRSILVDKDGHIIAGNKTAEAALKAGLHDAIVVETEGDKLVVVKRNDVTIEDDVGRQLAIADNRIGELSLEWDEAVLAEMAEFTDLDWMFTEEEQDEFFADTPLFGEDDGGMTGHKEASLKFGGYQIYMTEEEAAILTALIERYANEFGGLYGWVRYHLEDVYKRLSS